MSLEQGLERYEALGWEVVKKSDSVVEMTRTRKKPAVILNIFLVIISYGLWIPIWLYRYHNTVQFAELRETKGGFVLKKKRNEASSKVLKWTGGIASTGLVILLAVAGISYFLPPVYDLPDPVVTSSNIANPDEPLSGSSNESSIASDPLDAACSAMRSADLAVGSYGTSPSQLRALEEAERQINETYTGVDGDFYWYMVGQGNNIFTLRSALESGNSSLVLAAVDNYLADDEYTRFCR